MRKTWDYTIDLREEFVLKKGKLYLLSRIEREEIQEFVKDQLKKIFIMEPVLVILDLDKKMRVEADISNFAIEGVLLMKCENEKWRLIAYILKLLNKAERNYEIHDKEMLVIIRCLEI